jgi:tripartite-type tricarboxylate transporter receptor subunit TctC
MVRLLKPLVRLAGDLALCAGLTATALAQQFPSQPITLVVPWPPGGGSDIAMRLVADTASKKFGSPVVVVNKPGAGGTIGLKEMASSKPDGYTLGMLATGAIFSQYNNPNANAMADFEPIAFFGDDPALLSASAKTGFKSVADFINAAKAGPGKIKNGNDQPGGSSHITISLMEKKLGVRVTKVPYAGFAPTVQALLAGELDTVTVPAPDIVQHHKSGAARILGVAANERHFLAPDVPTFKEQGIDFIAGAWRAIAGPKGIPADRLALLEAKFLEALRDKEFQEKAKNAGFLVSPMGRTDTVKRLTEEDNAMYPIFLEAGLVKTRQK